MKWLKRLSFRAQIFLASLCLVILPVTMLGIFFTGQTNRNLTSEYLSSMHTITSQTNAALDTLLQDAFKVADLPLLSDDVRKSMIRNYGEDYISYARDTSMFLDYFRQINRLSDSLDTCLFRNRYGYTFEYNLNSVSRMKQIYTLIEGQESEARGNETRTWFGLPFADPLLGQSRLRIPMIRILYDRFDFTETGLCYAELNFRSVEQFLNTSSDAKVVTLFFDTDRKAFYASDPEYQKENSDNAAILQEIAGYVSTLPETTDIVQKDLRIGNAVYQLNSCTNKTTGWTLVQFSDNQAVAHSTRTNLLSHLGILLFAALLGLLLALLLSYTLSHSVSRLCTALDAMDPEAYQPVNEADYGSNRELQKLIISYNRLQKRLSQSIEQSYHAQLGEQKMRNQMLQFQINHHFLYNTLNVIQSLAVLHDIPQIASIVVNMSEMLRYNLDKFPTASLEEELQQVQRYMNIQSIRFPGKYTYDIQVPKEYLTREVPVFLLQPLVENSVEHGFSNRESGCMINILCCSDPEHGQFQLMVADNGNGIPRDKLAELRENLYIWGNSIGLHNIAWRLRGFYKDQGALEIESMKGSGTIITLKLPL